MKVRSLSELNNLLEGRLLALPANIRLGWKLMTVTNTLAFYETEKIMLVILYSLDSRYSVKAGFPPT